MAQSVKLLEMQLDVFHRDEATKAGGLQPVTEDGGRTQERGSLTPHDITQSTVGSGPESIQTVEAVLTGSCFFCLPAGD